MASKKKKGSKNAEGTTEASLLFFYTRLSLDCCAIASYLKKPKGKSNSLHTVQNAVLDYIWIRWYLKLIIAIIWSHTCTGIHIICAVAQLLHRCMWWGPQAHECIQSRRTARCPHYHITELQTGPPGFTPRQICVETDPEQAPSPPSFTTLLPISTIQEAVRRVQTCQAVQSARKTARCCLSFTPCHPLSPPSSSWRCAFTITKIQLGFNYKRISAHPQDFSCPATVTISSDWQRSYFWVPGDINMPRTSSRGGLRMPLPTQLLSTHSPAALSHLVSSSSIQSPADEATGAKQALR